MKNKIIIILSTPLIILTIIVSAIGLFSSDFYSAETLNWQAQSLGQDMVDLFFVTPCLIITTVLSYRNNAAAKKLWAGVMLYLTYTFVLYCFDVHFNSLFFLYCLCLGLSFYSFVYYLITNTKQGKERFVKKATARLIGYYFISIAVIFYFLWLGEIIPAVFLHITPQSVLDVGLPTNGVHVLDLAILLPAIFLTGIFLLKRFSPGFILAPVILTFFILMDVTIGALAIIMKMKGIQSSLLLTSIMGVFAAISLALLIGYLKNIHEHHK